MTYSVACRSGHPVKAICLSGGYKDTDEGHWMLYSGQGGRDGKGHWVSACCQSAFQEAVHLLGPEWCAAPHA